MGLLERIFPYEENFFKLLYEQSSKVVEGMETLSEFMHNGDFKIGNRVIEIEKEADELRRILIDCLDKSFITPIDREDIFQLSGVIDDIIDYARSTVEEMEIYELEPNDSLVEMVDVLLDATECINNAMKHLEKHKAIAAENAVRAKKYENEMETMYRLKLKSLVKNEDFSYVFRMREVYRHLSNLADKVDLAANVIGHIIVKLV